MRLLLKIICLCLYFQFCNCEAQLGDLAKVEYTIIPAISSSFEFNRTRFAINYPIKLNKKDAYVFLGLDYSNINIIFGPEELPFDKENLDGFQLLDINIGYTSKINDAWRIGARLTPGISSNLKANDLNINDVVISADLVFIKDLKNNTNVKKPNRLILGVSYSENRGFPYPLPFVSYYRKVSPHFSYNLGVPKSNIQYHINTKHRLKLYAQLDGFTSNIQNSEQINGTTADRFNMSLILSGFHYEYHIKSRLELYAKTALILNRNVSLRNRDNEEIFSIDTSNGLILETGLRFKI